jgi:hypothetical protein
VKEIPDLIVIHRSAFFHAMNLDFQIGYPPFKDSSSAPEPEAAQAVSRKYLFTHLQAAAQDRLQAFLGYAGLSNPKTRFLVYSRGGPGDWAETAYRQNWTRDVEQRFPVLKGRVFTIQIEGGDIKASFRDPATVRSMRHAVRSILGLKASGAAE